MFKFLQILSTAKNSEQPVSVFNAKKYKEDQEDEISPLYFHPSRQEVVQQYYVAREGDPEKKYNHISRQLQKASKTMPKKLEEAARNGHFTLETPVYLDPRWEWTTEDNRDKKSTMFADIAKPLVREIHAEPLRWETFCPQYDAYKRCVTETNPFQKRPSLECEIPQCVLKASWDVNLTIYTHEGNGRKNYPF